MCQPLPRTFQPFLYIRKAGHPRSFPRKPNCDFLDKKKKGEAQYSLFERIAQESFWPAVQRTMATYWRRQNHINVRVSPETAIVSLVDCEISFFQSSPQNGKVPFFFYSLRVVVPLYTPPELQDKEFREVSPNPNHDNFWTRLFLNLPP